MSARRSPSLLISDRRRLSPCSRTGGAVSWRETAEQRLRAVQMVARLRGLSCDRRSGVGNRSCSLHSCRVSPMTPRRLAECMRACPVTPPAPKPARSFSAIPLAAIQPRSSSGGSSRTAKSSSRCGACRQLTNNVVERCLRRLIGPKWKRTRRPYERWRTSAARWPRTRPKAIIATASSPTPMNTSSVQRKWRWTLPLVNKAPFVILAVNDPFRANFSSGESR